MSTNKDVAEAKEGNSKLANITLGDGTQVPLGMLPGMSQEQFANIQEYLLKNPELAKGAQQVAKQLAENPAAARNLMSMPINQQALAGQDQAAMFAALRDDPELKPVFDDIQENGTEAMAKYWDDRELMTKLHYKMEAMKIAGDKEPQNKIEAKDLAHAAKLGDLEAVKKFIEDGQDINKKDAKGVTPLGYAIGFNRIKVAKYLHEKGGDVQMLDEQGNTLLHYAAGYGRKELVTWLLEEKVPKDKKNKKGQTAADAAKMNHEKAIVELLTGKAADS